MSSFLSIIIPVYNSEKYLSCCIDSVLNQSFADFDLFLIDDGSTDGGSAICDAYSKQDSRIKVFHKNNGGVSSARNVGLDIAKGEWAFFLDSDDLLPNGALEALASRATGDVDLVYGRIQKFNEVEDCIETIDNDYEGEVSVEETLGAFVASGNRSGDWQRYLFNRIYRMSIIKEFGLRFNENIHYKEDGLFVVQYLCRCWKNVRCISDIVYLYRQTSMSAMGSLATAYNPKLLTNIDSHGQIYLELKQRNVSKDILDRELNHLFQNYEWISGIMKQSGVFTKKNERLLFKRIIKNAGPMKTFYHFVILRYSRMIKRKLINVFA